MAWADEVGKDGRTIIAFVRIQGIPFWIFQGHSNNKLVPDWTPDTDVTHIDGLEVPGEIAQILNPSETFAEVQNLQLSFVDLPEAGTQEPLRFSRLFNAPSRPMADSTLYAAFLGANVDTDDTAITLSHVVNLPADGEYLYLGNETVKRNDAGGASPLTVVRAQFPAVTGAGLPTPHRYQAPAGIYLVSGVHNNATPADFAGPESWYNRLIALYFTWIDENGNWGPKAEAHRRWIGRIVAPREAGENRWTLDCKPITEDLKRQVFAIPAPQAVMASGIEFRGILGQDRNFEYVVTDDIGSAVDARQKVITMPAQHYDNIHEFAQAFQDAITDDWQADGTYGAGAGQNGVFWLETTTVLGGSRDAVFFHWDWTGTDALSLRINMSRPIAIVLGVETETEGDYAGDGRVHISTETGTSWDRDAGVTAPAPYATTYWDRQCSSLEVIDMKADFTTTAMGDGSNPAIEVGGILVARYTGISGDSFTLDPFRDRDNQNDRIGVQSIVVRTGEEATIHVRQVYMMARTFGVSGTPGRGIFLHLLRLATSTGSLVLTNGIYDVYPHPMYGAAIPSEFIDLDSFTTAAELVDPQCQERQWVIRKGTGLDELISPDGQALGFYVVMNETGQISIRMARRPMRAGAILTLTDFNKGGDPENPQRTQTDRPAGDIVNAGRFKFNMPVNDGDPRGSIEVEIGDPSSLSRYGEERGEDIEHGGLFDFDTSDAAGVVIMAKNRIGMLSHPRTTLVRTISRDIFTRIAPGDVVLVTDPGVIDTDTGLHGITSVPFMVLSASENWREATGEVTLVRSSIIPESMETPVCPSATVNTAAATGVGTEWRLTLNANDFSDAAAGDVDRDSFALGDVLQVIEGSLVGGGAPNVVYRTITLIGPGANQIEIDNTIGGLNPATSVVYITFAKHETDPGGAPPLASVTAQTPRGTWIAGSDGLINNDTGFLAHTYEPT